MGFIFFHHLLAIDTYCLNRWMNGANSMNGHSRYLFANLTAMPGSLLAKLPNPAHRTGSLGALIGAAVGDISKSKSVAYTSVVRALK